MEIGAAHYIKGVPLGNFRRAWEETNPESELSDDYGLGTRDSLQVCPGRRPPKPWKPCMARASVCSHESRPEAAWVVPWYPAWCLMPR